MDFEQNSSGGVTLIFYGPAAFIPMAAQGVQGVTGGFAKGQDLNAQADATKDELTALEVQHSRNLQDMVADTAAAQAQRNVRVIALGAAGTAQGTELTSAVAATGGMNLARMQQDFDVKRSTLRARMKNLKAAAKMAPIKGLLDPLNLFQMGGAIAGQMNEAPMTGATKVYNPANPMGMSNTSNGFSQSTSSGMFGDFG